MGISKVIHEGGVTAGSIAESQAIGAQHGLRPILAVEARETGDIHLLLSPSGVVLGVQASSLYSATPKNGALLTKIFTLAYDVGAAMHHCVNLAKSYEAIVRDFARIRSIPGFEIPQSLVSHFGYRAEPYYELDSLLSAARRAYDKMGLLVWEAFRGRGGGAPSNIVQILDRLESCPPELEKRLGESWSAVGEKLKDYRDCTQHFASMDVGFETVRMRRLMPDLWRAQAPIPDNPEVKSKTKFTYEMDLDALTYGWQVVNEVVALATAVVGTASIVDKTAL
jgi:hypothetical protein